MNEIVGSGSVGDHVDIERLLAYAHGESGGDEADAVLRHGLACRECGNQLAVMLALRAAAPVAVRPATTRWATPGRRGALAAGLVIALMVSVVMMSSLFRDADGGGAGSASFPAEDVTLGARLATSAPPDQAMLDGFLFLEAQLGAQPELAEAFGLVVEQRYDDAVARLQALHEATPGRAEVAAVLGMARYLRGETRPEVEALLLQGNALPVDDLRHLSAWYLANLYLRRGDLVQARDVLDELAQWPDLPGERAVTLLARLNEANR